MELQSASAAEAREPGAADPELTALFDGSAPIAGDLAWTGSLHPAVYVTLGLLVILVPLFLFLVVYRRPTGPRETDGLDRNIATHWSELGYGRGLYGDGAVRRAHAEMAPDDTAELSASPADAGYRRRLSSLLQRWKREGGPGERRRPPPRRRSNDTDDTVADDVARNQATSRKDGGLLDRLAGDGDWNAGD
ncbi:MAG: hypothetical protein AAFP17_04465 [Pseudomonadota bacterium]